MSKYNSKKITVDGICFDSKDEALYYQHLLSLKAKGKIKNFILQPKFVLIPSFRKEGKLSRAITYTPDFLVEEIDGTETVLDVKGFSTQQGELRRKIFDWKFPELKLKWVTRNLKYGDDHGWIDYDDLKKKRTAARGVK